MWFVKAYHVNECFGTVRIYNHASSPLFIRKNPSGKGNITTPLRCIHQQFVRCKIKKYPHKVCFSFKDDVCFYTKQARMPQIGVGLSLEWNDDTIYFDWNRYENQHTMRNVENWYRYQLYSFQVPIETSDKVDCRVKSFSSSVDLFAKALLFRRSMEVSP